MSTSGNRNGLPGRPNTNQPIYDVPARNLLGRPRSTNIDVEPTQAAMPLYTIPDLQTTYQLARQPAKKEHIGEMLATGKEHEGRGSPTRGWSSRAPQKGRERHQLKAECGEKCFLRPNDEGFPICPSPRMTGGKSSCEIDCGGVQAAYNRARQYHYDDIAGKAQQLLGRCN